MKQSVQQCTLGKVSPATLAQITGSTPDTIRRWVKRSGAVLPKNYAQKLSNNTSTSKTMEVNKSQQLVYNLKSKCFQKL